MAKFVFFAVLVAALAAVSLADGEAAANYHTFGSMQCQRELQESSLEACRQVVDRQLVGQMPFLYPRSLRWSTGLRMRCCQQLQDISRECRCAAVRRMVRKYEQQTMAPLGEEGYYGETTQQQQQGYYGETAPEQQQGYYGETAPEQQGEQGYYGEATRWQQGGQGYYGRPGRCTTIWRRPAAQGYQGQEHYYGSPSWQTGYVFPPRFGSGQQQTARVRLTRARQYAANLPAMCRLEPQECSIFSAGQCY